MKIFIINTIFILIVVIKRSSSYKLVGYWGQNGGGSEKNIDYYCKGDFDIIVIGFVENFNHPANKDKFPSINLSKHCGFVGNAKYPRLYKCPASVRNGIKYCQDRGKKVFISLGGATETYGLKNDEQARQLAIRIWNLYLGGTEFSSLRPFGDVVLDGVDLDIEHQDPSGYDGYDLFTKTIHAYMERDKSKNYIISGAPQCFLPEKNMNVSIEKAGAYIDEIYIQYYNNPPCSPDLADFGKFKNNFLEWIGIVRRVNPNMKIFVGLPAHQKASGKDTYFKKPEEVVKILEYVKDFSEFGGMMLWDAGYDQISRIYGQPYSKHVKDILKTGKYDPVIPTSPPKVVENHKIVAYWGQNGGKTEKDLQEYCTTSVYKVVVIGFVHIFFSKKNKWEYPGINLSKHCGLTPSSDFPDMLRCGTAVQNAIKTCQSNGKRVYISLGGATKTYGIPSKKYAESLAFRIWNLFLGGTLDGHLRPFGAVKLDGVDLDIEYVKYPEFKQGNSIFLKKLHDYFVEDPTKTYYISGAPQCVYPDVNMNEVLQDYGHLFDELYIQYYNNPPCVPRSKNFKSNFERWMKLATDTKAKHPNSALKKILIGLPAAEKASGRDDYFQTPEEVANIFNMVKDYPLFGGFMIWDAGFDESKKIYGQRYSYHVNDIMKNGKYDPVVPTEPPKKILPRKVVAYWGQNGADEEKDLNHYCQSSAYDVIVIAYMNIFFDPKSAKKYPGINLSKHCGWTPNDDYPNLFQCPSELRTAIRSCQSFGKKVMLGIGGPYNPSQDMDTEGEARELAKNVWNLFFNGKDDSSLRPFGSQVIFDGIVVELQLTASKPSYHKFIEFMNNYMKSDLKKTYYIALSTNCAWPDKTMENILSNQAQNIDELYVRFYDKGCDPGGSSMKQRFLQWVNYVKSVRQAHSSSNLRKILIGLPASKDASKDENTYLPPKDLVSLVKNLDYDEFGGILLYDVGFDESNQIVKQRYSNHVKQILTTGKYEPKEPTPPPPRKKIVAYWGQNGGTKEKPLMDYCQNSAYDIIAIGFMHVFFHHANRDQFPAINLARHCTRQISSSYPGLLNCPEVGTAIKRCQANGKKVFISMGGATRTYGIPDKQSAEKLAERVWNLFLGGTDYPHLRPFGSSAILDGIDLDIEHVTNPNYDGYPVFTRKIREYMDSDKSRKYYISGAPQCPYPDKNMKGALEETGHLFDEIYIQYYNNYCFPGSGHFRANFAKWVSHLRRMKIEEKQRGGKSYFTKIFVGLPTHTFAAVRDGKPYYKTQSALKEVYHMVADYPEFAGFMLWDAGWDSSNKEIGGKPYSYAVENVLKTFGGPRPSHIPTIPTTIKTTTPKPKCKSIQKKKLVVYWGQDSGKNELDLYQYCVRSDYDTIVIGFVTKFFDRDNSNEYPHFDVSKHCALADNAMYPSLYRCKDIERAIKQCQKNNKKVLISIGGPGKEYGFRKEDDAKMFAKRMWNLFLGGFDEKDQNVRPFGSAILNGVDLYVNHAESKFDGYPMFMSELRKLMKQDSLRKYIISAKVRCTYIEKHVRSILSIKSGPLLDEIYIQYYDMACSPGNPSFNTNFRKWKDHAARLNEQKTDGCVDIYLGIPVNEKSENYKIPARVESDIFTYDIRLYPELGGFMLWDAGWDEENKIKNKRYSYYIKRMLEKYDPKTTAAPSTTAITTTEAIPDYFKMAGFWGSNRAFKQKNEYDLLTYCRRKSYDVIIMNTLSVFFDDANVGDKNLPRLNFARHCVHTFDSKKYPTYLHCPQMASHIKLCQQMNRKILLSLGGGTRWVGFGGKEEAEKFAENLWNLFLGGTAPLRTFGDAVLDGINLDIRLGRSSWFPDFVFKLRELMNSDPKKKQYMLTASPVCKFPHHTLGETFKTHSRYFDQLYVSFDDPSCYVKNAEIFIPTLKDWLGLPGPDILIGLPSHLKAAYHTNSFLTRDEMRSFIRIYLSSHPRIKGIALDDVSWDDLNIDKGERFSDFVGEIIKPRAYATLPPSTTQVVVRKKGSAGWVKANGVTIFTVLLLSMKFFL